MFLKSQYAILSLAIIITLKKQVQILWMTVRFFIFDFCAFLKFNLKVRKDH